MNKIEKALIDIYEPYLDELNININKDTTMYEKRILLLKLKYKKDVAEENVLCLTSLINEIEKEIEKNKGEEEC